MANITAIILTLNEEGNIERALDSVSFAEEVIVIDSFSEDKTVALAKAKKAKVLQREFDDFSSQKNYAISKASNSWVFLLDADEYVTNELRKNIEKTVSEKTDLVGYYVWRKTFMKGRQIKFGGHTNKIIRLFKKETSYYEGVVHEKNCVNGKVGFLEGYLNHYTYKNYNHFKNKIEFYAKLKAQDLFTDKETVNLYHLYIKPFARFCIHYFLKLGFLDGKNGIIFSYLMGYGVWRRYKELNLLNAEA